MTDWTHWINLGVPMVILVSVGWCIYKVGMYLGHRLFDDDRGLVCTWVAGEQKWRTTLTERLEQQQDMCSTHTASQMQINDSIKDLTAVTSLGNSHLEKLVSLHDDPTGRVSSSIEATKKTQVDVQLLKKAAIHACDLCEEIARDELKNIAPAVAMHCGRIRAIIEESK
jgi:hypothetical protein